MKWERKVLNFSFINFGSAFVVSVLMIYNIQRDSVGFCGKIFVREMGKKKEKRREKVDVKIIE